MGAAQRQTEAAETEVIYLVIPLASAQTVRTRWLQEVNWEYLISQTMIYSVSLVLTVVLLGGLYMMKCAAGINLLPTLHLRDLFPMIP